MTTLIAALFNVAGPDMIIIFCIFGIPVLAFGSLAVFLMRYLARKDRAASTDLSGSSLVEDRLRTLQEMKAKGTLSNAEYESQRQKIISQI